MADSRKRVQTGPHVFRGESAKIILEASIAGEIKNFSLTKRGTLEPVNGPTKLMHYMASNPSGFDYIDTGIGENLYNSFLSSRKYGIHHAVLANGRDILLLHTEAGIQEFQPQNRNSTKSVLKNIIGSNASIVSSTYTLKESANFLQDVDQLVSTSPQFPTQFVTTDKGIIIVPQSYQRAYIYDGTMALPLGYDTIPSPPIGLGPTSGAGEKVNDQGYTWNTTNYGKTHPYSMGQGRLGTLSSLFIDEGTRNKLLPGSWRTAVQWLDYFGNFSPMSDRSGEISFMSQSKHENDTAGDDLKKALIWDNIDRGPKGTVGRRVYRTKDLINSGDGKLYFLSGNLGFASLNSNVSLPDNFTEHFPDNIPDGYLSVPALTDIMPVPSFKLAKFCLGRLWIGNTSKNPGMIAPSLPGRYGTFQSSDVIYPDASSQEITGLWSTDGGLLAFTQNSTFLIMANDKGDGFRTAPISTSIGCVAPSSLASLPNGSVCWLGKEGFYRFTGKEIEHISGPIQGIVDRITKSRALQAVGIFVPEAQEYRCWLPMDGGVENSLCMVFDNDGWRRRTNEHVSCACISGDHRKYLYCGGSVYSGEGFTETVSSKNDDTEIYRGFFILDRENNYDWKDTPLEREYVIETGWLEWTRSVDRVSAKTVYLSLVESSLGEFEVEVYRDWRKSSPVYEATAKLHSEEDIPVTWGETDLPVAPTGDEGADTFLTKRPFWKSIDISVPSCEVYKIRIKSRTPFEFIGLITEEELKVNPKTRVP